MTAHPATTARAQRLPARLGTWLAVLVSVAMVVVVVILPRVVHGAALTVRTGSMSPALQVGDLAVIRRVDPTALRVGDVATYEQASGALITHRIVAIDARGAARSFVFRGDANRVPDPDPVAADAVRGRVWFSVPYVGAIGEVLGRARPLIVTTGVLALAGFALAQFAAVARDHRRRS